jgi:uncharacterized membrane protein YdcZ (DUF606 family)
LIVGQLITGALVDTFGLFGDPVRFDLARALGIALLVAGSILILRP